MKRLGTGPKTRESFELMRWSPITKYISRGKRFSVYIDHAVANLHDFVWQRNHALDKRFAPVERIPEYDYIVAFNRLKPVYELVDENPLLIGEKRRHAGAFHLHRLIQENDDNKRQADRNQQIARPYSNFSF